MDFNFQANDIKKGKMKKAIDMKKAIYLSVCGGQTNKLLRNMVQPDNNCLILHVCMHFSNFSCLHGCLGMCNGICSAKVRGI